MPGNVIAAKLTEIVREWLRAGEKSPVHGITGVHGLARKGHNARARQRPMDQTEIQIVQWLLIYEAWPGRSKRGMIG
jgi:hypothetical protein